MDVLVAADVLLLHRNIINHRRRKGIGSMGTCIIVALLLVIIVFSCIQSVKHFKGEGGCCGGENPSKPEKKKLKHPVIATKKLYIEGMHCQNCAYRIQSQLNKIDGVSAQVSVGKKVAVVSMDRDVDSQILIDTVEALDYTVITVE